MKKYMKLIIFLLIVVVLGVGIYIFTSRRNNVKFNEGYVNGNTAGNLYNEGQFCEYEGTIYFANPDDGNKLYSMDSNGNNLKKISSDIATFINVDANYIYYVRNNHRTSVSFENFTFFKNSLCRIDKDGKNVTVLDEEACTCAALCGNYIYYLHYDEQEGNSLYKVKIDGTDCKQVLDKPIYTCCAQGKYIYYHGMETDGSIYRLDTTTDQTSLFYGCTSYKPIVNNENDIYFLDGNQNNALVHTDSLLNDPTVISEDSIDHYNVYGNTVYYQNYDKNGSALCSVKTDGSGQTVLYEGDYTNIHVTSNFVFFTDYNFDTVYYFNRNTPNVIQEFHPGVIDD